MICPNCGKNTRPKELCDHCKKPTEFATRFNIQPGEIPGLEEQGVYHIQPRAVMSSGETPVAPMQEKSFKKNNSKIWGIAAVLLTAAISVGVTAWLISFHLSMNKTEVAEETEATVSQTETIPTEATQPEYQVVLDWNLPQEAADQEELPVISYGESLPVLTDKEGYFFLGWNTNSAGEGTFFRAGDQFMIPLAEDLVLYAQWEQIEEIPAEEIPTEEIFPEETFPKSDILTPMPEPENTEPEPTETDATEPITVETEDGEQL